MSYLRNIEAAQPYFDGADVIDLKSTEAEVTLREFLAGFLSYYPAWIQALYGVRAVFVRLLGMKQEGMPRGWQLRPEQVRFEVGGRCTIFIVEAAIEDDYWIGSASDSHLAAYLMIAAEPLVDGRTRFHVGTTIKYRNWAGPVYFAFVRPFHHLVVLAMMRAGVRARSTRADHATIGAG
jgi:hypothetical protein